MRPPCDPVRVSDSLVCHQGAVLFTLLVSFHGSPMFPTHDLALSSHLDSAQSTPPDCNSEGPQVVTKKQEVMTDLKNPNGDEEEKQQNMSPEICLLLRQMPSQENKPYESESK